MQKQPLNSLVGEGSQVSQTRTHDVRIPLSSIFEVGRAEVWDSSNYGATKMSLELNLDKLAVIDKTTVALAGSRYLNKGAGDTYQAMNDVTNGSAGAVTLGTANYKLTSKVVYESLEDSLWYVGQKCTLVVGGGTATRTNIDGAGGIVQIASITHAINTTKQPNDAGGATNKEGQVHITLTAGVGSATNGQTWTGVTLVPLAPTTTPVTINNIELVAKMTSETETEPTQYTTYQAQEDSAPASASINRTYSLPPNTTNVYVMFNNPIYSSEQLDSYRITLDGVDKTNRQVRVGSALHYDLISQVYQNRGSALGSTKEQMKNALKYLGQADSTESIVILMCPIKLKQGNTQLGLELNATTGQTLSGKIIVFSEVVKEI